MPAPVTDYDKAKQRLARLCAADTEPTLDAELDAALDRHARASVWAAVTAYSYGDEVIPVTRNGRRFKVVTAGTSAATEPSWPDSDGGSVTDGDVVFEEVGLEYDLWDIEAAAYECWMLKAAKASEYSDNTVGGDHSDRESQVYEQCLKMARHFIPIRVA